MSKLYKIITFAAVLFIYSTSYSALKFSERLEEYTLSNGLNVILIKDNRSPLVVNSIWYKVGSSYEKPGNTGISHVLEHMMFKGTKNFSTGEFSSIIKEMGGTENGFTSKDYTGYFQKVHKSNLEKCIELEADRMNNLIFNEKEILSEIEVVKEERRLRTDDNPISKTFEKIMLNAYGMNNYGIPIIGTMDDIGSITKKDLKRWYKTHYHPKNAIVIIAGNFDNENVKKYIEKYYGSINSEKQLISIKEHVDHKTTDYFEVYEKVAKPIIFIGFKKQKFNQNKSREHYALELFIEIMDGGYSSRLTKRLVNEKKIALDTFISNDTYNQHSNLLIIGGTPRGNISTEEFQKSILTEFSKKNIDTITANELNIAKARIKANNIYKFDSVLNQAMQVGMLETKNISWRELDKYTSIIDSIKLEEIKRAGEVYFVNNNKLITIINPEK
tara:strand:+ start:825 stop:2156 length:1332 start_codon:yes stop_codon:yes gene_type:complete